MRAVVVVVTVGGDQVVGGGGCSGWGREVFRGVQWLGVGFGWGRGRVQVGEGVFRWGVVQVGGIQVGVQGGAAVQWGGGGVQWGEGSEGANVRGTEGEQRGKRWAEHNGIFLQFEFRYRKGLGRTLALHKVEKNAF